MEFVSSPKIQLGTKWGYLDLTKSLHYKVRSSSYSHWEACWDSWVNDLPAFMNPLELDANLPSATWFWIRQVKSRYSLGRPLEQLSPILWLPRCQRLLHILSIHHALLRLRPSCRICYTPAGASSWLAPDLPVQLILCHILVLVSVFSTKPNSRLF